MWHPCPRPDKRGIGASLAIGALLVSCQRVPETVIAHGEASHQFVSPPPMPPPVRKDNPGPVVVERKPRDVFVPPTAEGEQDNPIYPAAALAESVIPVTMGVKITIDATGHVSAVGSSLAVISVPHKFSADFQAAIEAAVYQWRFKPAEIRHVVPMPGPGDYWLVQGVEKVESSLDVAFTFSSTGAVTIMPR
jgi:hypothetical protein